MSFVTFFFQKESDALEWCLTEKEEIETENDEREQKMNNKDNYGNNKC